MPWSDRLSRIWWVLGGLVLVAASSAAAQPDRSRVAGQLHVLAAVADDPLAGVGAGLEVRTSRRVAVVSTATLGRQSGSTGFRWEGMVTYWLEPPGQPGTTWYGGGGVVVQRFADSREYLLLVVGVERRARGSPGWFGEIGLGGGVRGAVGLRLRPSHEP